MIDARQASRATASFATTIVVALVAGIQLSTICPCTRRLSTRVNAMFMTLRSPTFQELTRQPDIAGADLSHSHRELEQPLLPPAGDLQQHRQVHPGEHLDSALLEQAEAQVRRGPAE